MPSRRGRPVSRRLSPARFARLVEETRPAPPPLPAWFDAAHTGGGAPWLLAEQADALVRHALTRGEGVTLMEAAARAFHEPPRDTDWEILGNDPKGENWEDHRDPARAYALFQRKLARARADGVTLLYKIWLARGDPG